MRGKERQRSLSGIIGRWVLFIVIVLLIVFAVLIVVNNRTVAGDNTMYPTIETGDLLLEDQLSIRLIRPSRDEFVSFTSRYQENVRYIRRIVGMPGETVEIRDGSVYINGKERREKKGVGATLEAGQAVNQLTLGQDEYFVMCDNREELSDSREPNIGGIRLDEMEGRILMRLWPAPGLV